MEKSDAEKWDRARVACRLLGAPEPPPPAAHGFPHALVSLAAVDQWQRTDRPGSLPLPRDLVDEGWASAYAFLSGWQSDPHKVGLLADLNANPYEQEMNRTAFDNGRAIASTAAGKEYRQYVEACRRKATSAVPGMRIP